MVWMADSGSWIKEPADQNHDLGLRACTAEPRFGGRDGLNNARGAGFMGWAVEPGLRVQGLAAQSKGSG